LQHLLPKFEFVPKSALLKYRNVSPNRFGINRLVRNVDIPNNQFPVWTLFTDAGVQSAVIQPSQNKSQPVPATSSSGNTSGTALVNTAASTSNTASTGSNSLASSQAAQATSNTGATAEATGTTTTTTTASNPSGTTTTTTTSSGSSTAQTQQTVAQQIASILLGSNSSGSSSGGTTSGTSSGNKTGTA
jgi:hypothetical protein